MITAEEIFWIREQIEKTGKVAPVDVDKLIRRLLSVLNAKLKAKLLKEGGLNDLLEQYKAQESARLSKLHAQEVTTETKRLKVEFNSKSTQLELRVSQRIQEAKYAESIVDALEVILKFALRAWDGKDDR